MTETDTINPDVLRGARQLLADPDHWTKGEDARAADGGEIAPEDCAAVCWCLGGAIVRSADNLGISIHDEGGFVPYKRLILGNTRTPLFAWNDSEETTHADVLAALDRAIATASAETKP